MNTAKFGPFLSEQRKKHGMTQSQLAEKLHVSTAAVSKWERGICLPEVSKLEDLAQVFDLPLMALMQCEEPAHAGGDYSEDAVQQVLTDTIRASAQEKRRVRQNWIEGVIVAAIALLVVRRLLHFEPIFTVDHLRQLTILDELFHSDSVFFLLVGAAACAYIGTKLKTAARNRTGLIICLVTYALCEALLYVARSYLAELILLALGTLALGGVAGFLLGLVVSLLRKDP